LLAAEYGAFQGIWMKHRTSIFFYLNGIPQEVRGSDAGMMLADFVRIKKRLTGTKIVCAEGDCGACSVLKLDPFIHRFVAINSCITTVAQMDCSSLVTVDALAVRSSLGTEIKLSPVQQSMVNHHASQCGFCTPGFVVAITSLVEKKIGSGTSKESGKTKGDDFPVKTASRYCTPQEAKNCMTGNLCRCTGYQPIIEAALNVDLSQCESIFNRFTSPAQFQELWKNRAIPVLLKNDHFSFYAPIQLKDAIKYWSKNKTARLISAGTDLGVVHNKGRIELTDLISLHLVPELDQIKQSANLIRVGAGVNLAHVRRIVKHSIPEFSRFLDLFASPQIKNVATLAGNIGNASPIADTPPFLLATNAVIRVQGPKGKRKISLDQYYLAYRETALRPLEIITSVEFEIPKRTEKLSLYKSSQRKDLDISSVNAAFRFRLSKRGKIEEARIALGGVAAIPLRLKQTEAFLKGKLLHSEDSTVLKEAVSLLQAEITPQDDVRGSAKFRRALAANLFLKYYRSLSEVI
jgi:xanthine dehydrogenase small subunit